jgi:hypothetical protein
VVIDRDKACGHATQIAAPPIRSNPRNFTAQARQGAIGFQPVPHCGNSSRSFFPRQRGGIGVPPTARFENCAPPLRPYDTPFEAIALPPDTPHIDWANRLR